MLIQLKTCTECGVEKPVSAFKSRPDRVNKTRSACRACNSEREKARIRAKNADTPAARTQVTILWSKLLIYPLGAFIVRAVGKGKRIKDRALLRDDIWLKRAAMQTHCPITGLEFSLEPDNPMYPSLDRIDSAQGYTPANTRVISLWANVAKRNWTDKQLQTLIQAAGLVQMRKAMTALYPQKVE